MLHLTAIPKIIAYESETVESLSSQLLTSILLSSYYAILLN